MYIKSNKKGSASFFALLLSLVIVLISIIFNWFIREQLYFTEILKLKIESKFKNFSIANELIYAFLTQTITQNSILLNDFEFYNNREILIDGSEIYVDNNTRLEVRDTNGLVSLSTMNTHVLGRLIKSLTKIEPSVIIDSLLDWIDEDNLKRLNGFEKIDYEMEGLTYSPRNYPLQYKEELMLIKGVTKEIYDNISNYLTILPNNGFNPNTAPKEVLAAYLNIDVLKADELYKYIRKSGVISNDRILNDLVNRSLTVDEGVYYYPSRNLEIKIENFKDNKSITRTSFGLIFNEKLETPYQIFYWKDE